MAINKENIKQIHQSLDAAIRAVGEQYGISFSLGTIRFDQNSFRCKLEGNDKSATGTIINAQTSSITPTAFASLPTLASFLGNRYRRANTIYEVIEIKPNRPSNPFIVRTQNGTRYKCGVSFLGSMSMLPKI
jgi:hypothetical protein